MNLSVKDVLKVPHQQALLSIPRNAKFRGVSTDSRTVGKGDLFVALRGEKFDGHNFLKTAKRSAN
jgi:UDP-N-acetylmuramyl pentapeptide synthase